MGRARAKRPLKVLKFEIQSTEDFHKEIIEAFEAARLRKPFKPRIGTSFSSVEAMRNFLTPKRLEILRCIREKKPTSIYSLARMTRRGFASVFRDVDILKKHGIVSVPRVKGSARRARMPKVECDAISVYIGL
jgi:predicted transcriptional regulator